MQILLDPLRIIYYFIYIEKYLEIVMGKDKTQQNEQKDVATEEVLEQEVQEEISK